MMALTVLQPYASLIAAGVKPWEWRPTFTAIRARSYIGQRIAIPAGSAIPSRPEIGRARAQARLGNEGALVMPQAGLLLDRWYADPSLLPLGAIVATALLTAVTRATEIFPDADPDRWGLRLEDVQPLAPVVPAKGRQGWWNWSGA